MNKFEALLLGLVIMSQWALILRAERKAPELVFLSQDPAARAEPVARSSGWIAPRRLIVKKDKDGVVLSAEEVVYG